MEMKRAWKRRRYRQEGKGREVDIVMRDGRGEGRRCQVSHLHMYGRSGAGVGEGGEVTEVDWRCMW